MLEEQLKRIADALEAIAINLQPTNLHLPPTPPPARKPSKAEVLGTPAPVKTITAEGTVTNDAGTPVEVKATVEKQTEWSLDDVITAVQAAVKVNREAALKVCEKYGYIKTIKEIPATKYSAIVAELTEVK